jgi:hypothetical protein
MNILAKTLAVGLISLSASSMTLADTPEEYVFTTDASSLQALKSDYAASKTALKYIDTLALDTKLGQQAFDIISLNLMASRNADLESSAEGREATQDDVERHKGYIVKAQSVAVTTPQLSEPSQPSSYYEETSSGRNTIASVMSETESFVGFASKLIPIMFSFIALGLGLTFFFNAARNR